MTPLRIKHTPLIWFPYLLFPLPETSLPLIFLGWLLLSFSWKEFNLKPHILWKNLTRNLIFSERTSSTTTPLNPLLFFPMTSCSLKRQQFHFWLCICVHVCLMSVEAFSLCPTPTTVPTHSRCAANRELGSLLSPLLSPSLSWIFLLESDRTPGSRGH